MKKKTNQKESWCNNCKNAIWNESCNGMKIKLDVQPLTIETELKARFKKQNIYQLQSTKTGNWFVQYRSAFKIKHTHEPVIVLAEHECHPLRTINHPTYFTNPFEHTMPEEPPF